MVPYIFCAFVTHKQLYYHLTAPIIDLQKYSMFRPKHISIHAIKQMQKKGKATPAQAWTDHEGCRRLWLPDFKTVGT